MPRAGKPLSSPLHLLHRASQRADGLFFRNVGTTDLTPRQYAVLQSVADNNGLSQTDIMAATGIDRSSTADLVRRLVINGSLQRRRTRRDARIYAVRITSRGRALLVIGAAATSAAEDAVLALIPERQREAFLAVLARIAAAQDL
jgi:DNA-binding MarR family transcriptional regulator